VCATKKWEKNAEAVWCRKEKDLCFCFRMSDGSGSRGINLSIDDKQ
jgi:hypothetical protein